MDKFERNLNVFMGVAILASIVTTIGTMSLIGYALYCVSQFINTL